MAKTLTQPQQRNAPHWFETGPLATMRREFEDLLENFWSREAENGELASSTPRVDLSETDDSLEIVTDLPGIKPDEVVVDLHDNCLRITAEHKSEREDKPDGKKKYHRIERSFGRFSRSVWLPCPVDESKVDAKLEDGVLKVTLPKSSEAKARRIEVKS